MSWGIALLPHLDQANLYTQWNFNQWYLEPSNQELAQTMLPVFLCPTVNLPAFRANGDAPTSLPLYTRTDYAGNYGERAVRCFPLTNCQNNYSSLGDTSGNPRGTMMLQPSSTVLSLTLGLRNIVDGTSTTMLIGEAPNAIFGIWAGHKNVMDQSASLNNSFALSSPWASCAVTAGQMTTDERSDGSGWMRYGASGLSQLPRWRSQLSLFCDGSGPASCRNRWITSCFRLAIFSYKGGEMIGDTF